MKNTNIREAKRVYRHKRVRKTVLGTSQQPRVCVHRSLKNMQAHIIDDVQRKTLLGASTLDKDLRQKFKYCGNMSAATALGEVLAEKAKKNGIVKVCFDRGGYLYHGRVKAFAEALRKGGLDF